MAGRTRRSRGGLTSRRQQLLTPRTGASIAQRFADRRRRAERRRRAARLASQCAFRRARCGGGGASSAARPRAVVRGARRYTIGRYATNLIGAALVAALASAVVVVGPIVGSVLFVPLERLWVNYLCDMRIALCVSLLSFGAIIGLFNHLGWLEEEAPRTVYSRARTLALRVRARPITTCV